MQSQLKLLDIFNSPVDETLRAQLLALPQAGRRYLIAFTPRSGSSYLCDLLKLSQAVGQPGELLSAQFVPEIRRKAPSHTPDEYLDLIVRRLATDSVSGLKASWFQFDDFRKAMVQPEAFLDYQYIYLTRRDQVAQAVSLYRATATEVFHTNIESNVNQRRALAQLPFDPEKIDHWQRHIQAQERGWQGYFAQHRIFPLCISYEDIVEDTPAVLARIGSCLNLPQPLTVAAPEQSVFKKLGGLRSLRWASRYRHQLIAAQAPDDEADQPAPQAALPGPAGPLHRPPHNAGPSARPAGPQGRQPAPAPPRRGRRADRKPGRESGPLA